LRRRVRLFSDDFHPDRLTLNSPARRIDVERPQICPSL